MRERLMQPVTPNKNKHFYHCYSCVLHHWMVYIYFNNYQESLIQWDVTTSSELTQQEWMKNIIFFNSILQTNKL